MPENCSLALSLNIRRWTDWTASFREVRRLGLKKSHCDTFLGYRAMLVVQRDEGSTILMSPRSVVAMRCSYVKTATCFPPKLVGVRLAAFETRLLAMEEREYGTKCK